MRAALSCKESRGGLHSPEFWGPREENVKLDRYAWKVSPLLQRDDLQGGDWQGGGTQGVSEGRGGNEEEKY